MSNEPRDEDAGEAIVYLNGRFLPVSEACIPVTDRGFLFGDGVYEVIPAYGGRLLRLPHHLQRLQNSLDGIRLHNPLSSDRWRAILEELLQRNRALAGPDNDQSVYLQVTRGSAAKRDHRFPEEVVPTVYATSTPLPAPDPAIAEHGIRAVSLDDIRWRYCDIKAVTLLPNVLLRQQATERDAAEAILIRDGLAIEGSASNLFIVRDGIIETPPKGPQMLPGITRDLVLELAARHGLAARESDIPEALLRTAAEIWITSSTREIVPVTELDGKAVGDGRPGPLWKKMSALYRDYKDAVRRGAAE
ncbi:MAG TPA: D-amino acid aminotransferase [Gammaproteobacteria bacterium]|nr:D-amino acid aminotransferase [Gammaproteobacteria bacterium]